MPSPFRRSLPIAGVAVIVTAALALADQPAGAAPRVRPETIETIALVEELLTRSATGRDLVDRLNHSDVIVYVRHRSFTNTTLDGRTGFLQSSAAARSAYRYLIIELACGRRRIEQLVTLGHELRHALEIAVAADTTNAATLETLYSRIGFRTSGTAAAATFETEAAITAAARIRRELYSAARTTDDDRH